MALTISTVFLRFFAPPSDRPTTDCDSLSFRFILPPSSPSDRSAIGASLEPSSDLTFPEALVVPLEGPAAEESAGSGRFAVERAAETDAEGARMLIFFDFGFLFEGL